VDHQEGPRIDDDNEITQQTQSQQESTSISFMNTTDDSFEIDDNLGVKFDYPSPYPPYRTPAGFNLSSLTPHYTLSYSPFHVPSSPLKIILRNNSTSTSTFPSLFNLEPKTTTTPTKVAEIEEVNYIPQL
jgi:hypothetical protein